MGNAVGVLGEFESFLEAKYGVKSSVPSFGFGQKAGVVSAVSGPYMHGPGGLFGTPGLKRDVISTRVLPKGILSVLPSMGTNEMQPLYPYITGFLAPTGSNPNGTCDDPMTAGPIKNCIQTATFGRYPLQTRAIDVTQTGQITNRGEFLDLRLMNDPLLGGLGGMTPPASTLGVTGTMDMLRDALVRFVEVGVDLQDIIARQIYNGNPANNTAGGGYMEFPGLNILIGTTKVDAITGTPCPSLASIVEDMAYGNVTDQGGQTIVNILTYMMRNLKWNASRMNMGGTEWAIVMRPTLWWELTAVWPCAYLTYRCQANTNNTQTQLIVNANDQIDMRDEMRNGMYLMIDGYKYNVILDDAIDELNNNSNGAIGITSFASPIYVIPLTARDGQMPTTYIEYFDFSGPNGPMTAVQDAGYMPWFWTDDGKWFWWRKTSGSPCIQWGTVGKMRVIELTPHLAGRINNVQYTPLIHERDPFFENSYFVDGGVQNRSASRLYSDWNPTVPA